jgi:ubiquinol-cytochrome c reductase cytochrome c subunit
MMQLPRRRLFACLAILMASAASTAIAQSPAPPPAPPGDVAAGRRAFVDYGCYYCHGTVGQGSLPTIGPRVARVPRSFDSFRNYVRRPAGRMSSYPPAVIDDPALVNIYAYLRSLPEPASLPALLNELRKR